MCPLRQLHFTRPPQPHSPHHAEWPNVSTVHQSVVTFASDHPETDPKKWGEVKLGKGPVLHRGPNINPVLEKLLFETADKHKIPYQLTAEPRATGTDANAMQLSRGGTATALISIPNRYMHTPVEVISTKDLDNTIKLIVNYLVAHPATRDYRP